MTDRESCARVIVIGAGFSGLTTAYRLMQKGYDVVIYEARERIGGRVFSILLEDDAGTQYPAELGAQNIKHGGDAKNLRALAHELGLDVEFIHVNIPEFMLDIATK